MRLRSQDILPISLALLFGLQSPLVSAASGEREPVSVKRRIEPRYPGWAYTEGIGQGYAKIAFYVDEYGEASEYFVIEYSQKAFAEELLNSIVGWRFVPEHLEGEPVKSVCHVYWKFYPDRPINTNALFDAAKRIDGNDSDSYRELRYYTEKELDEPLAMTSFPGLQLPRGTPLVEEGRETVRVRLSFFVDQQGGVRLPHVLESSVPALNEHMENVFKAASFVPVMHDGERAIGSFEKTYDIPIAWVESE